ncbi:MAG: glycosyltransferase [Verrucomicrobia bacterium]|nr:glycosyltransferase [Verrucomicrobiota bacterium]MBV9673171.1 glycosyltransferase [Verrucomicrobiota bacterium]
MLTILPPPETESLEVRLPRSGRSSTDRKLKICDLTQFYSPLSGGVKRYLEEKRKHASRADIDHLLVVPGERSECIESPEGKTFFIRSPLVARKSRYRALLNLNAVEEILEREKPNIIESSDPYQLAWKAIASGEALRIPIVAFYHSHFPEAYVRTTTKYLGESATKIMMEIAKDYIRNLYNHFKYTFVPSAGLAQVLADWGVGNVCLSELGVDTQVFTTIPDRIETRACYGIPQGRTVLLYVGRLAAEKNVKTLFQAFELLHEGSSGRYHFLIVGNGSYRDTMQHLQTKTGSLTWLPYCSDQMELARIYRAADLFVHPSVQETFGLVALESQSCGTPVVGIRGSYMDRIIFADQSHWAKENTPLSLAAAIQDISRTDLRSAGDQASRRVAERYSWNQVFHRMFDIYHQLAV